jgi:8-oxo-dGTP pyrophosphatase MutT (NUDIX family)
MGRTEFYESLREQLLSLPGEDSHLEMFPLRARSSEALKAAKDHRVSAVMALIFEESGEHYIIVIERQDYEGKHSGQMGFPGGKWEEQDQTELAAALRETQEEIGIDPASVVVLGSLTNVYIPVSNFLVHPFVGFLDRRPDFKIDEREVKAVFPFKLRELFNPGNKIETTINVSKGITLKNVPAFLIEGKIIWGATALMLNELRIVVGRILNSPESRNTNQ